MLAGGHRSFSKSNYINYFSRHISFVLPSSFLVGLETFPPNFVAISEVLLKGSVG